MRTDPASCASFLALAATLLLLGSSIPVAIIYACNTPPETPASAEIAPEPQTPETIEVTQTVTLQPSFSNEDGVNTSRVELCYTLEPGQTIHLLVKGDPPIPSGGFISIGMNMELGIELVFREPEDRGQIYRGNEWSKSCWLPADHEQRVIMLVKNTGDKEAIACLRLAYEYPPEPEPDPKHKDINDPPLPEVSTPAPTPKAL